MLRYFKPHGFTFGRGMAEPFEILFVEDYEPDVQLVVRLLTKNRITNKLHVAYDGVQALDFVFCREAYQHRAFGRPPLVILLDIRLPKVDGWTVLRQIKQDPRTSAIPVIMVSGSFFTEELERCQESGAVGWLSKPIRIDDLRKILTATGLVWSIAGEAKG